MPEVVEALQKLQFKKLLPFGKIDKRDQSRKLVTLSIYKRLKNAN